MSGAKRGVDGQVGNWDDYVGWSNLGGFHPLGWGASFLFSGGGSMSLVTLWRERLVVWGEAVKHDGFELNVSPNGEHAMMRMGDVIHEWNMDIGPRETKKDFHERYHNRKTELENWVAEVKKSKGVK